ncbi:MAG: amino acid kinase family protein [Promethearchaeota archaeon]
MAKNRILFKVGGSILGQIKYLESFFNNLITYINQSYTEIFILVGGGSNVQNLRNEYKEKKLKLIDSLKNEGEKVEENKDENDLETYYHFRAIMIMSENSKNLFNFFESFLKQKFVDDLFFIKFVDLESYINQKEESIGSTVKNINSKNNEDQKNILKIINEEKKKDKGVHIYIIDPYPILKKKDPLPHSWAVTSDTISLYFAYLLKINIVILLKNVSFMKINNKKYKIIEAESLYNLMKKIGYIDEVQEHLGKGTKFPVDPMFPQYLKRYNIYAILFNIIKYKKLKKLLNILFSKQKLATKTDVLLNKIKKLKNMGSIFTP